MIVQTTKGKIEGTTEGGVNVFRGIPFAAPPTGALRWRAPQDPEPWPDVKQTVDFSKSCLQPVFPPMDGSEPIGEMSEDCLYLNVWTAQTEIGPMIARPVMVWIHGGAYKIGDGISTMYNGVPLAKQGAVVVTFNYRLGHLGFFAHPTLEREFRGGPVNFGLLDQIKVLEWVRDNIHGFGGDPGNVTIFGESAGGASVLALYCAPAAATLFHRGIAQSAYAIPEASRAKAIELGANVAKRAWGLGDHPTLEELRGVPPEAFQLILTPIGKTKEAQIPVPSLAPVAVWGDEVLPNKIRATFDAGTQHALPLIIGSNSNEESVLEAFGMKAEVILDLLEDQVGKLTIAQWKGWYKKDDEIEDSELDDRERFGGLILRDILFTMQARWIATRQAKKASTYRYYFSYVPVLLRPDMPHGVPHGGEMVFPFDTGDIALGMQGKFTDLDRAMASKVSGYWFTFANGGTPEGAEAWPKHDMDAEQDKILKLGVAIEPEDEFRKTRLNTFAGIYPFLEAALENGLG